MFPDARDSRGLQQSIEKIFLQKCFWKIWSKILMYIIFSESQASQTCWPWEPRSKSSDDRESLKLIENDVSRGAGRPATAAIVWENNFGKIMFLKIFDQNFGFSMILEDPGLSDGWYFESSEDCYWCLMPASRPDPSASRWHRSMSVLKVLGPRSNILFRAVESPQNRWNAGPIGPLQKNSLF